MSTVEEETQEEPKPISPDADPDHDDQLDEPRPEEEGDDSELAERYDDTSDTAS